jgi:hypothetical protein
VASGKNSGNLYQWIVVALFLLPLHQDHQWIINYNKQARTEELGKEANKAAV